MKTPIIYSLSDPITGEVRYIGKTKNELHKRLSGHYKDKSENYKTHWIASLKKRELKPSISIIEICTEENWEERERYWISFYKNQGSRLTNLTDGGEGLPRGYKHSKETIEKIRQASKKPNAGQFSKGRIWESKQAEGNWKVILQYDLEGNFIREWKGIVNAAKELNLDKNLITACLKNKRKMTGGFQWKYYSEDYPLQIEKYKRK